MAKGLRLYRFFQMGDTDHGKEQYAGFLPFSASVCYTSFALVAEILRKGGGAFYAIPMDHFFTMRDLQECGASAWKDVWPMRSC
jgi:hypothetical protein